MLRRSIDFYSEPTFDQRLFGFGKRLFFGGAVVAVAIGALDLMNMRPVEAASEIVHEQQKTAADLTGMARVLGDAVGARPGAALADRLALAVAGEGEAAISDFSHTDSDHAPAADRPAMPTTIRPAVGQDRDSLIEVAMRRQRDLLRIARPNI